ncbi:MAG: hypothetical protein Tsb0013_04980 [Phycisphaerales bacterium]
MRNITKHRTSLAFLFGALGLGALVLSACNTIEGAGEDVAAVGDEIDDTAEDAN